MAANRAPRATEFLPLHGLEFRILLSLLPRPAHGYHIVKTIEASEPTWSRIFPANLYRRIRGLSRDGLLAEVETPANHQGAPRKYFALTDLGREVASAEAERLRALLSEAEARGLGERARQEGRRS